MEAVYVSLVTTETPEAVTLGLRSVLAFLLLAVPTTFMGATLPLLTDFFQRHPLQTKSWKVGLLYAANTFGAAAGTLAASFFLIELIGVNSTNFAAAMLNFIVAFVGYRLAKKLGEGQRPEIGEVRVVLSRPALLVIAMLAASGGTALAAEVLWTRPLGALVGNSTYAFATILLVYLTGIAAGSWAMSRVVSRLKGLAAWLVGLQGAMGLWTIVAIFLLDWFHSHLIAKTQSVVTMGQIFAMYAQCISILLPLALLSGAMFPVATRMLDPDSRDASGKLIARAYAWNTIGALIGSLLAGFLIAPLLDFYEALYLLAVIYAVTALAGLGGAIKLGMLASAPRRMGGVLALAGAAVFVFGLMGMNGENHFLRRLRVMHPDWEAMHHQPGIQGVTTVLKRKSSQYGQQLLVNGRGMTAKVTDTKMMAHLPLLLHPDPEKTLVICFGMGTTFRSAITHQREVTVVELVPEVLRSFDFFYEEAPAIRQYPRGRMVANDGRNFLRLTRERFDIITVDPPPPIDAAGVNSLYSRDFVELARSRLAEGGILAHWIPSPGTGGVYDEVTFYMLLSTMYHAFEHTYVLTGVDKYGVHVLGSDQPIRFNLPQIKERLAAEAIGSDLREWKPVPLEIFTQIAKLGENEMQDVPQISDDLPHLEFNLLRNLRLGTRQPSPIANW
jgi:spermidine synthase